MNLLLTFIQLAVGVASIFASLQHSPISHQLDIKPFSNQHLARIVFLVAGVGLFLGSLFNLWFDWNYR